MSEIGNIYARYGEALNWGIDDFEQARKSALEAVRELYDPFLSTLVRRYDALADESSPQRANILRIFREQFNDGRPEASFAAIDGTSGKEQLSEMMVFYGASYAQNGTLNVGDSGGRLSYARWTPSEDTSFVAYLPVPLYSLAELDDQDWLFRADDGERSAAAMIHTGLMQLAEIYLAYRRVTSEDRPPRIVLLDHSLSSTMLSCDVMHLVHEYRPDRATLGWIGAQVPRWGRPFEPADAVVAHAHPMNKQLQVPSIRGNALAEHLVAAMTDYWQIGMTGERDLGRDIDLRTLQTPGIAAADLRSRISSMESELGLFRLDGDYVRPVPLGTGPQARTLRQRWNDLRALFDTTCELLFRERRLDALQLTYAPNQGRSGRKWMDDNDVRFLVGLGLRLLIEVCWQKRVLLIGIAKDSASRFLSKNFLSVADCTGMLSVPRDPELRGTDRTICEMIPLVDPALGAPWSTVEIDACFMTLRALMDPQTGQATIQGVRGDVVIPSDGLFMRSLVQLFLRRRSTKSSPLMGHVLFMDRIAYPYFDARSRTSSPITVRGGALHPMIRLSGAEPNVAQDLSMVITDFLTKNLFPEAIGQPDPLHRADQGAKALGKQINHLVGASIERFRQNPLAWSFRDNRDRRSR